ncbi:abortive infection protein, partial [Methylococcaceae bacterium CS4]
LPLPAEIMEKILSGGARITSSDIQTSHKKFDADNNATGATYFSLNTDESQGTKKFLALSAPILDTLKSGKILLIDEIDASLHPMLTEGLIKLFHNAENNPFNAQLIFTTHDVSFLSRPQLFGRDQIWFTEKNLYGSTELYSLLEFRKNSKGKDVRSTDNLEKHYLQGQFGAVPYLGDF